MRRSLDGVGDHLAHFSVVCALNNGRSIVSVNGSNPMNACPNPGLGDRTIVTTVSYVTTSASQGHVSTCTPRRNPMEFSMLVCIVGRGCPYLAFRPHMPRWAIVSTTPRHAVIDADSRLSTLDAEHGEPCSVANVPICA